MKTTAHAMKATAHAMKATASHPHSGVPEQMPLTSSLVLSIVLHGVLVLGMLVSAWIVGRMQPYRLSAHTVFLGGDSPFVIDQLPGEGGGASGTKHAAQESGSAAAVPPAGGGAEPAVEKYVLPMAKPVPPPPQPVVEHTMPAPPPRPAVEKAAPPPPRPRVEKPVAPTPAPKPVVEKAVPALPKPPPEAMTLAEKQKDTKALAPPLPTAKATEAQQRLAQLRERQLQQEAAETKTAAEARQRLAQLRERQLQQEQAAQAAQQRIADLRAEQSQKQAAQQRIAALRERVGSGGTGESGTGSGGGAAGTGSGSGSPGSGRGTGTAGAGGVGTGGIAGIRLRNYQALIQEKVRNAWTYPPQSKGLEAIVYLAIDRTGNVEQLRFVRKSGNALFDESLQRAIKQAEPLPPVPDDYAGRLFEADLNFRALD